jgi:hypothetical protein
MKNLKVVLMVFVFIGVLANVEAQKKERTNAIAHIAKQMGKIVSGIKIICGEGLLSVKN